MFLNKKEAIKQFSSLYNLRTPFLFIISFNLKQSLIIPLNEVDPQQILYDVKGKTNGVNYIKNNKPFVLDKNPLAYPDYLDAFNKVQEGIKFGNTYLLNLTFPTPIHSNLSLEEIFYNAKAKYKLYLKDQFVVFSPEPFFSLNGNRVTSNPMKGTIDASIPAAASAIINDIKEKAEHTTIVDLIRNDLSIHIDQVKVDRFRYLETITTNNKKLIQVSSEISGSIDNEKLQDLGGIIYSLLPAGSISGAPKVKTLEIINRVEGYDRGFYTGVFGIFDGSSIESSVMIRFIENVQGHLIYKSGGGIHKLSDPWKEYQELIDKIYVPFY